MRKNLFYAVGCFLLFAVLVFTGCAQTLPPPKTPEEMLKDAVKKLTNVDSNSFDLNVKGNINDPKDQKPTKLDFDLTLGGAADLKDVQDPHINLKFNGSFGSDGRNDALSFEARLNKEAVYGKLDKIVFADDAPFLQALKSSQGSWWKIPVPPELLKEVASNIPRTGEDDKLTPDQKKMKELLENARLARNLNYAGNDDVKGEQSFRYTFEVDKIRLKDLLKEAAGIEGKAFGQDEEKMLYELLESINAKGSLWIAKESGILNQLYVNIQFVTSEKTPGGTLDVRISFWNFNKPVVVETPKEAKLVPMEALMGFFLGGLKPDNVLQGPVTQDGSSSKQEPAVTAPKLPK